jgi:hypothetical protein
MDEASPIDGIDSIVVTIPDGTVFHAQPVYFGGPSVDMPRDERLRWQIWAPDGVSHVGPPIEADRSPAAVQGVIESWWKTRRASTDRLRGGGT